MQVKLPSGDWVNPIHVSGIELERRRTDKHTCIWFSKAASYRTSYLRFEGDKRDELAELLNRGEIETAVVATQETALRVHKHVMASVEDEEDTDFEEDESGGGRGGAGAKAGGGARWIEECSSS